MTSGRESGQAAVELVGILPLLAGAILAVAQLLAAGVAHELAGHAAEAAAVALGRNEDPSISARRALPGWSHARVSVSVAGRTVRVRLRPAAVFPGTASLLSSVATADAGPSTPAGPPRAPALPDVARSRDDPAGRP